MENTEIIKKSGIHINVSLDKENLPTRIQWKAEDSGLEDEQEAKAMIQVQVVHLMIHLIAHLHLLNLIEVDYHFLDSQARFMTRKVKGFFPLKGARPKVTI